MPVSSGPHLRMRSFRSRLLTGSTSPVAPKRVCSRFCRDCEWPVTMAPYTSRFHDRNKPTISSRHFGRAWFCDQRRSAIRSLLLRFAARTWRTRGWGQHLCPLGGACRVQNGHPNSERWNGQYRMGFLFPQARRKEHGVRAIFGVRLGCDGGDLGSI